MFVVDVPPRFEANVRAGRRPELQFNIDATAMQQASIGAGYIKRFSLTGSRASCVERKTNPTARHAGREQGLQSQRSHFLVYEHCGHH